MTSTKPIPRWRAWAYVFSALLTLTAGLWAYLAYAPSVSVVKVELGGSGQRWPLPAGTASAVRWDFAFIAGYALALLFGLLLARAVFGRAGQPEWPSPEVDQGRRRADRKRHLLRLAYMMAVTAVLSDVAENALLLAATAQARKPALLLDIAAAAAVVKFCTVLPVALAALAAMAVAVVRLVRNTHGRLEHMTLSLDAIRPPDRSPLPGRAHWAGGYVEADRTDGSAAHDGRARPVTGFCLSGGGVRAAAVALGALQSLRDELLAARYLVSVSGGGYTSGALQLALTGARPDDEEWRRTHPAEHDPRGVLMPGSVEEDRFRRHASYIADTPGRLVVALAILARVFLMSVFVLFAPAIVLGYAAGRAYQAVPLARWNASALLPWAKTVTYPDVRTGTLWAGAALAGLALLAYLVSTWPGTHAPRARDWLRRAAINLTVMTLVVAALAVAIPAVVYAAAWLLHGRGTTFTIAGPVGTVVVGYVAMLVSAVRRKQKKSLTKNPWLTKVKNAAPAALQFALVAVTVIALAAAWLLLFGGTAAVAGQPGAGWTVLILFAALAAIGGFLDATALSLHPFYRRRLAEAFDARRIRLGSGQVTAEGYDFGEATTLSAYGTRSVDARQRPDFPEVIFATTANLAGEHRAPLNAVSYTMSGEWTGGPDVGYVRTADLEHLAKSHMKTDLTVQAAVAISGAAFASAMGRMGRWYGALLAVTGARLGSWLPSPAFVHEMSESARAGDWTTPALPSRRRLHYLVKEVLGSHRYHDRLIMVTDGGHYDNLGLVELLRRRCGLIYCIDASGDSPPVAGTLRQAMDLAFTELGVQFGDCAEAWELVPGSGRPLEPHGVLKRLNDRLSKSATLHVSFQYPEESGLPPERRGGTLIVAKTILTPDMPYGLLARGASDRLFPRDPTSDQFFDDDKYCGYTALGRELGEAVKRHHPGDVHRRADGRAEPSLELKLKL